MQIVGATGRGKTASVIAPWFIRDFHCGNIPILIDGKGDEQLAESIRVKSNVDSNRDYFKVFNLADSRKSCRLNPLDGGSAEEIADRLICSLEFESSYYRDIQHAAVLTVLEVLKAFSETATLPSLYEYLADPGKLLDLARSRKGMPDHLNAEVGKLCAMNKDVRDERFSGLLSQLRPFVSRGVRELVSSNDMDLVRLIQGKHTSVGKKGCIILLNSMQYQKTAKVLGKLTLQLMAWASSQRPSSATFTAVYVDEFSSFVYDGFEQFLNKARSRNIGIHISHQSVGDLESISPSFAKTVNVNTNIKVLMGLNDPDTADYFARHLGTRSTAKTTERAAKGMFGSVEKTGDMSLRDVEQYKIHPNKLKHYSNGQGVLSLLVSGIPVVEEVQFDPRTG